jgi:hypothetical protein
MTKCCSRLLGLMTVLLLLPTQLFASGGADLPELMVLVADTRKYSGWEAWWGNIYNEGHLEFALITTITIPVAGAILGLLADLVMSRIGIDLKKRALAEH